LSCSRLGWDGDTKIAVVGVGFLRPGIELERLVEIAEIQLQQTVFGEQGGILASEIQQGLVEGACPVKIIQVREQPGEVQPMSVEVNALAGLADRRSKFDVAIESGIEREQTFKGGIFTLVDRQHIQIEGIARARGPLVHLGELEGAGSVLRGGPDHLFQGVDGQLLSAGGLRQLGQLAPAGRVSRGCFGAAQQFIQQGG
jgi:hypothetical protein